MLLWLAQLVYATGNAFTTVAASVLIYRQTGSVMGVGFLLIATTLPALLTGLLAGALVDRIDRRRLLMACDALRAILVCLIPVLAAQNIIWLFVLTVIIGTLSQFHAPAYDSLLPEVVPDASLAAANSLMFLSQFGATALGFAASGALATGAVLDGAFYTNGLTYLFSFVCLWLLRSRITHVVSKRPAVNIMVDLQEGARHMLSLPAVRNLFIVVFGAHIIFGLQNTLDLPFALRVLGGNESGYGNLKALEAVGFTLGSLLMARMADRLREGQWVTLGWGVMAILSILYGLASDLPQGLLLMLLTGLVNAPACVAARLLFQRSTERSMRGRVSSAFYMLRDLAYVAGMLLASLSGSIDLRSMFVISSIALLVWALASGRLPGLGQPAAEWRRAITLLRAAPLAAGLGPPRAATLAHVDALSALLPALGQLPLALRERLSYRAFVADAATGNVIVRQGDTSTAAYFILSGGAVAGVDIHGRFQLLEVLRQGDFFGEVAALTGVPRTASVVAESDTHVMQIPSDALRELLQEPALREVVVGKLTERTSRTQQAQMFGQAGIRF